MFVRVAVAVALSLLAVPVRAGDLGFAVASMTDLYRKGAEAIASADVLVSGGCDAHSCKYLSFKGQLAWTVHFDGMTRVTQIEFGEAGPDVPPGALFAGIAVTREMLAPEASSAAHRTSFIEIKTLFDAGAVLIYAPLGGLMWTVDRSSGSPVVRIEQMNR